MMETQLIIRKLSFIKRPIPLPADYRPMYKIALIILSLKFCCRGESANLLKLHLLSWSMASMKNMDKVRGYINSNYRNDFSVWGIEPALNRALQLAVAENICDIVNGKNYKLTEKGNKFYKMIAKDKDLFALEKSFLSFVGKNSITDSRINAITQNWNLFYDKN